MMLARSVGAAQNRKTLKAAPSTSEKPRASDSVDAAASRFPRAKATASRLVVATAMKQKTVMGNLPSFTQPAWLKIHH